jgi:hypothetical protein
MKDTQKLTKAFLNSGNVKDDESEKIELDNLDRARLVLKKGSRKEIEVENEHGTRFPISDLSKAEVEIFLFVL